MTDRSTFRLPADITHIFDLVNRLSAEADPSRPARQGTEPGLVAESNVHLLRKAQAALQKSEDRFRSLIERDTNVIVLLGAVGTVLYHSSSIANVLGYTPAEWLGQSIFDYFHPADRSKAEEIFAELRAAPRKPVTVVLRCRHQKGGYRWLEGTGTNLLDEPGVKAVVFDYRDVTERNQAEAAMRESEQRFRQLVHSLAAAIYTCDAQGRITLYNEAAAALWGRRPDLAKDRWCGSWRILDLDGSEVPARACPMGLAIREGRSVRNREIIIERPDGSRSFVLPYPDPLFDESGTLVGGVNILVDLTEPKRAIAQLRDREQWLKAIFEQAAVGVAQLDAASGRFLRVNQRFCAIVGHTRAELEQRSFSEITHEQDAGLDADDLARLRAGTLRELDREKRCVRKDGSIVWVSLAISSIGAAGEPPVSFIAVAQDITGRKQAERETQRQAAFAHFNPNPVLELSATAEVTYANEVAHEMARSLGAQHPREILPANIVTIVRDCLATSKLARIETQAGPRTIAWLFFPVATAQVVHCTAGEITERKRLEEHFLQAQKMEALGQFSGGVAHDFNNILAVIMGYTELARMTLKENAAERASLDAVLRAANRATDLVRQILTFSRQQPQVRRTIQLQPVVAESIKLLRSTIPSTIEFATVIAPDAPAVLADANQIHQILMNLGTNAWHAMKDQPGRLELTLERHVVDAAYAATQPRLRPGVHARISISDTGCGMDAATLRRIFEPFFTTKPPGEGTGLGLAVVHGIMDSHDAAVTVHSEPGRGTTFRLYFPQHADVASAPVSIDAPTPLGQGQRILIVDDEEPLAQLGEKMLLALGYAPEFTTVPAQALARVRADPQRFALVLTDQTMPGMSGLLLATQLRQLRPGLPILLMTGYSAALTAERLAAAGVHQLLLKPTTLHALGTAVHAALSIPVTAPDPSWLESAASSTMSPFPSSRSWAETQESRAPR